MGKTLGVSSLIGIILVVFQVTNAISPSYGQVLVTQGNPFVLASPLPISQEVRSENSESIATTGTSGSVVTESGRVLSGSSSTGSTGEVTFLDGNNNIESSRILVDESALDENKPEVTVIEREPVNPNAQLLAESGTTSASFETFENAPNPAEVITALNPPFRPCSLDPAASADQSVTTGAFNFATYTIAGDADIEDLLSKFNPNHQNIVMQIFVDLITGTIQGKMAVVEDKFKQIDKPVGISERQTLDEFGMKREEISKIFGPIINTECEITVTGKGGSAFVQPQSVLDKSQRVVLNPPFALCANVPATDLKNAIYTIEGFDRIKEVKQRIDNGRESFNLQVYNDLITGTIKGTLFADENNNGILDADDEGVTGGEKILDFTPEVTTECNKMPLFNT
jgi:hypothetical protein